MMGYRAMIVEEFDPPKVKLYMVQEWSNGEVRKLMRDGTWVTDSPYVHTEGVGFDLPRESIDALYEALKQFRGDALDASTEAKVLREWLASERSRVDALLSSGA